MYGQLENCGTFRSVGRLIRLHSRLDAMPRYFIALRDEGAMTRGEEGSHFPSLEDALTEAKNSARDMVRQFMDPRTTLGETCIEVRDTAGRVVAVLTVAEVLEHPVHPAFKNSCSEEPSPGARWRSPPG